MQVYLYIQTTPSACDSGGGLPYRAAPPGRYLVDQRLFLMLLATNASILLLVVAKWLFEGRPGFLVWVVCSAISAVYYALTPLIGMLWLVYVDFQIYRGRAPSAQGMGAPADPGLINGVFSFLSIGGDYLFSIGPTTCPSGEISFRSSSSAAISTSSRVWAGRQQPPQNPEKRT